MNVADQGREAHLADRDRKVLSALDLIARENVLPDSCEIERGAFLDLVHEAWRGKDRRGLYGHLSDERIAAEISRLSGEPMTRNQFVTTFGAGKVIQGSESLRFKTGITRAVAKAYLEVAFSNWTLSPESTRAVPRFLPLLHMGQPVSAQTIEAACDAMFPQGAGLVGGKPAIVYCRPSPGFGAKSFYRECGTKHMSMVVASVRDPVLMADLEPQLAEWEAVLEALLLPQIGPQSANDAETTGKVPATTPMSIHVWALREPVVSQDGRHLRAMAGIARLQTVFRLSEALWRMRSAEAKLSSIAAPLLWPTLNKRSVVAMRLNPRNDHFREGPKPDDGTDVTSLPVADELIFPESVPTEWTARGTTSRVEELLCLATVNHAGNDRIDYHSFASTTMYPDSPSVQWVPSPGSQSDRTFGALLAAAAAHLQTDGDAGELARFQSFGWRFFTPENFSRLGFPFQWDTQTRSNP